MWAFELGFKVRYNISVTSNLDIVISFWDDHYEQSFKNLVFQAAMKTDFRTVKIRGFLLLFSKAILSKINGLGLFTHYKNGKDLTNLFKSSLP